MTELINVISSIIEECKAANSHFQVWWALRNLALPEYYDTMNERRYVDFFHASNSGHYKLLYLALSKIYDRDERAAGIRKLRNRLIDNNYHDQAKYVDKELIPLTSMVRKIKTIRNQTIVHNQSDLPRKQVYKNNEITPNQIRDVVIKTVNVINNVSKEIGVSNHIFDNDRLEKATMEMLKTLQKGKQP
jgi:hypothetical protein